MLHEPPEEFLLRASVGEAPNGILLLNSSEAPATSTIEELNTIILGEFELPAPIVQWPVDLIRSSPLIQPLIDAIQNGTASCVGDRSFYPVAKVGAAAWIIPTDDGSSWIEVGGIIPGPREEQNSYRSEIGGLIGKAIGLTCLRSKILPGAPPLITACNGIEALKQVEAKTEKVK